MKKWIINALSFLFLVLCISVPLQLSAERGNGQEDEWQTLVVIVRTGDLDCMGDPSDCLVLDE